MEVLHKIDSEITNRCNAGCPLCPRTGTIGPGISEIVHKTGLRDVGIDVIQNILDSKTAKNLKKWSYCGNYGDPFMHPKVYEISELISSYGINQKYDTNGGMRKEEFWSELGKLPGVSINFAIDGLKDTNHLYRMKTDFDVIMRNAEAFIKSGGHADWVYIVFEHNEHQIEEASKLSKKIGFKSFNTKISSRGFNVSNSQSKDYNVQFNKKKKEGTINIPKNQKYQPSALKDGHINIPVKCKAIMKEQFYLTPDNMLLPCCHVHAEVAKKTYGVEKKEDEFFRFLIDTGVKYNLEKYDFDTAVESYRHNLPILKRYWENRTINICNRICGSNRANKTIKYN
jgi:MoaA/NifB/PqqE/SkfB family radical SAM enzyme